MTAPRPGDRVRVEFDGVVREVAPSGLVHLESVSGWLVPRFACTVIVPPIAVGDLVTADNIGQLAMGSVIARPGFSPVEKRTDGFWRSTTGAILDDREMGRNDAVVLRIGGGS